MTETEMHEKVAAAQDTLFAEVYLPAFVELFNKKAEATGITKIANEADLETALGLAAQFEQIKAANPQAQQQSDLQKAAAAFTGRTQASRAPEQFAKQASQNENVRKAFASLVA